ncbi:LemA family protein [Patescibacteria group bacterium]|nr:LemA family protein [Patescibacteria group bacterium]
MTPILWIVLAAAAVIILWLIAMYNGLIKFRNRTDEAWSDIDVQLKRRYDLIPNLVETVKGYAAHEKGVLEEVTRARTMAMGAQNPEVRAKAENMLTGALKSLFAVAENYPNLKANENFLELQRELSDTENKIQAARRFYNGNVRDFNTKIQSFPTNVMAGMFGFKKYDFFGLEEEAAKEPVKVAF